MIVNDRLRQLREEKNLSQGDIEKRTGLLRCYISRVENGYTVPALETLEKMARALEIPLYQLFYDGDEPPKLPNLLKRKTSSDLAWGSTGRDSVYLHKLVRYLGKATDSDRKLLLAVAQKVARERGRRAPKAA
ncbi:MAG TPA: helix-turn-helix transcriptional regulator [Candidatus Saccharimonadales bacterium]|nr:helix-turn-helix transcriptional regulator [Candidatus Saccharimonadales bacterium]